MTYIPNSTAGRLRWVEEKYRKRPVVIYSTLRVLLSAIGLDRYLRGLGRPMRDGQYWILATPEGDRAVTPVMVEDLVRSIYGALPEHSAADPLVPWFAARIGRLEKEVDRSQRGFQYVAKRTQQGYDRLVAAIQEYDEVTELLEARANAIVRWAEETSPDLTRLSIDEVLMSVATYDFGDEDGGGIERGTVLYQFDDGWTVQQLETPEQLYDEGEAMQHCVGSDDDYCEQVEEAQVIIYSLRDPSGNPHVTMEYDPEERRFEQIKGKQNDPPQEKYAERVRQFIAAELDSEPVGMMMAGAEPRSLDLRGADLRNLNLTGKNFIGADLTRANLSGTWIRKASFLGATLIGANLRGVYGDYVDFTKADLTEAALSGAKLRRSDFSDALMAGATLEQGDFSNSNFERADLTQADLRGSSFDQGEFYGAEMEGADVRHASFARTQGARLDETVGEPAFPPGYAGQRPV